jgi:hypothetical protein
MAMRVTIIEGTPAECREFLAERDLGRLKVRTTEAVSDNQETAAPEQTDQLPLVTTLREELSRVTDNARRAVKVICEHAPTVGYTTVADELRVNTSVLAGYKSSIGMKAPHVKSLITSDDNRRVYRIAEDAAARILEALTD